MGAVVVAALGVVVWLFAYFVPQGSRLDELSSERASLGRVLGKERVALGALRVELRRAPDSEAVERKVEALVPHDAELAGYTQSFTAATNSAGVMITSFEPGRVVHVQGTPFEETPITASIRGTYDHILKLVESLPHFTRLTVLNGLSISGGGPRTNRSSLLLATVQVAIFFDTGSRLAGSRSSPQPENGSGGPLPAVAECGATRDPFDPTGAPPPPRSPARC